MMLNGKGLVVTEKKKKKVRPEPSQDPYNT